ncbi:hypothetical protein L2E82_43988 [Cichorium intybus]|uniref:Uncharacterized protein n=1 Tax=Cichorium intybus TaxID=13427 RepID=A0ACB8ZTZ2_CICIN|nr:hypothetical protein L2E82_43988 [Cichorium intybus]
MNFHNSSFQTLVSFGMQVYEIMTIKSPFLDWLTIPLTPPPQHQSQITSSISLTHFQFKHPCTHNHQN